MLKNGPTFKDIRLFSMKLTENRLLTNNGKILCGLIGVLLCGIPLWIVDYQHYQLNSIHFKASCAAFGVIALLLFIFTSHRFKEIFLFAAIAHLAALFIKIIQDCIPDPTNHNLWPFEIAIALIIDVAIFLPVWLLGIIARKIRK